MTPTRERPGAGVMMGLKGIALGLALATVAVASSALSSTIIAGDSFTDGRRTGARGPKTLEWFSNEVSSGVPSALSVHPDPVLEGNALTADNPDVPARTFVTRSILGLFPGPPHTLGTFGDTLTLSFDFRFTTPLRPSSENRFRFGLYSTSKTVSTADGTAATRDDKGYWAQTAYGSTPGNTGLLREAGDRKSRLMEGGDIAQLGAEASAKINSGAKHTAMLSITRTGIRELTLRMKILNAADTVLVDLTRVDTNPVTYTFDEMVLAMHSNTLNYRVGKVTVTTSHEETTVAPVALGSRRELFVDTSLLVSMTQATLELQTPKVAETSINFMERPWEGSWSGQGPTVIKDGRVYRMYYYCDPTRWNPESEEGLPCYAESSDGITWTRPNLRQVRVDGTRENNVLLMPDPSFHNLRPFIDTRPGVPSSEKYKAVTGGALYRAPDGAMWTDGLYILVSADGLQWSTFSSKPFLPPERFKSPDGQSNFPPVDYDGMNTMFWSESEQSYVCYYRGWVRSAVSPSPADSDRGWYRWVRRTTSHDLVTWSRPVDMGSGGQPLEHWYMHSTSPYFRAPHIYIAMPSHYIPTVDPDFHNSPRDGHSARSETRFASSRDGLSYDRLFPHQRWVTGGLPNAGFFFPDQNDWPLFAGRLGLNVVPTGPREISVYLEQPGRVVRYTLRTDGFVALAASAGEVVTKPLAFSGTALEMNFATGPGGSVRVELQDAAGRPIPRFAIADATPMTGDDISRVVTWGHNSDLRSLGGQVVRVRLQLQNARVFSFRFLTPVPAGLGEKGP